MIQQSHCNIIISGPKRVLNYIKNRIWPPPRPAIFMNKNPEYANYSIGKFTYGYPKIITKSGNPTTCKIGNFCSIAEGVTILLYGEHKSNWVSTYPFYSFLKDFKELTPFHTKGDVVIGNDVWIGRNALILSGVCIGDGVVIGANTVVARDVEPYSVVVGNPARVIRKRFDEDTIEKLLKIKWWNWSYQKVRENIPLILSNRINEFIAQHTIEEKQDIQSATVSTYTNKGRADEGIYIQA